VKKEYTETGSIDYFKKNISAFLSPIYIRKTDCLLYPKSLYLYVYLPAHPISFLIFGRQVGKGGGGREIGKNGRRVRMKRK
jgi:hypothetical protein